MKTEQGLLRFDRMNESAWCFDMGDSVIPVETGMALSIQLLDRFEPVEILELPHNGLAVKFKKQQKHLDCKLLDPDKRYLAKISTKTLEEIIFSAHPLLDKEPSSRSHVTSKENDSSDLPF